MVKVKFEEEELEEEEAEEPEISVEEFLKMQDAPSGRVTKVDYDAVLKAIEGKPVRMKTLKDLILSNSVDKANVYPSEIQRWLNNLKKAGYNVLVKWDNRTRERWVLVRK